MMLTASCDDPSTVGTELIGAQGGDPVRLVVPLDVDTVRYDAITGRSALAAQSRVLAGHTRNDPLGDVSATGYIDFTLSQGPVNIGNETLQSVELRIEPGYSYGDTTQAATFALHDMTEEWDPAGAPADTSLADIAEGTPVTQFTLDPGDTLATVEMPGAWVQEHADELARPDSGVTEEFHGFQIEPLSEDAVVGFPAGGTTLEATFALVPPDTANPKATYSPTDLLSTLDQPDPQSIQDRLVLQDGTGRALQFSFSAPTSSEDDALPAELEDASLNRAVLVLEVDSTLTGLPAGFARPSLRQTQLFIKLKDEDIPRVFGFRGGPATFSRNGARFESGVSTGVLLGLMEDALDGDVPFENFQLRPLVQATAQTQIGNRLVPLTSLNSALIRTDAGHEPRLVITYTPTE